MVGTHLMDRPYVVINVATTADGKIDTVARRGAAISTERDRLRVDALRAGADAVMVGGRTLLEEDPRLTVRSAELRAERVARGTEPHPAKVSVLSRPAALKPASRFLTSGPARVILFVPATVAENEVSALRALGAEVYPSGQPGADLIAAMATLASIGMRRVLVEGGGSLNFDLLRLGLVDEIQVFVAPLIFGGATAPTLADGLGLAAEAALPLARVDVEAWPDGGVLLRYMVERR